MSTIDAPFPAGNRSGGAQGGQGAAPRARSRLRGGNTNYKWLVVGSVVFGIFMAVLDSTVVNIALAKLQAVFGANLNQIQWVVTGYLLAQTASIPLVGYLADRWGTKNVYLVSLVVFTLGSALCGLAWSTGTLIAFRVIQALGAGGLLPMATAMIFAAFPPAERGLASAVLGVPVLLAPALGPTLGGWLVQYADWRLIFYLNLPIGVVGFFMALFLLRDERNERLSSFDWRGFVLSALGFGTLVYGISDAASAHWTSPKVLSFIGVGILCLIALVFVELTTESPLLDMRLFKDWSFTSGNVISWVLQMALFGSLLLLPLFLQNLRGLSPFQAGLWLLPSALATAIVLPIGGILVDRVGAKWIILLGVIALTFTLYSLSFINLATSFWTLQLILLGRSVALAFTLQPANVVALYNVPRAALPRASSLVNVMRQVSASFGTALLATYVQNQQPLHYAHLAGQVTASSQTGLLVAQAAAGLQASQGMSAAQAQTTALQIVSGLLQRQAAVLSFSDTYLVAAGIAVVAIIFALFLRNPKTQQGASGQSNAELGAEAMMG